MRLHVATVLRATGAEVLHPGAHGKMCRNTLHSADLERELTSVTVDLRTVVPGCLFVDLRDGSAGETTFKAALAAGARGCVIPHPAPVSSDLWPMVEDNGDRYLFIVPDTRHALQQLATVWRSERRLRVIAVAGSVGAGETADAIAAVLAAQGEILRKTITADTGVSLACGLLDARSERIAVFDIEIPDTAGAIQVGAMAQPEVGVVTNIASSPGMVGSSRVAARSASRIIGALPANGLAILNGDDPWTRAMAKTSGIAPTLLIGISQECQYRAETIEFHGDDRVSFLMRTPKGCMSFGPESGGTQRIYALLAAAAAAQRFESDVDPSDAVQQRDDSTINDIPSLSDSRQRFLATAPAQPGTKPGTPSHRMQTKTRVSRETAPGLLPAWIWRGVKSEGVMRSATCQP